MFWTMLCWDTFGPAVHENVTFTHITYLNIVADKLHPFMIPLFTDGSSLFQQEIVPCHTANMVQEWFEEYKFKLFTWLPNFPDLNKIKHLWDMLQKQV